MRKVDLASDPQRQSTSAPRPGLDDAFQREARANSRLRLLIDGVKDFAIFMLDPDGNVSTWNAGAERLKGYSADEIIGQHYSCFYPPEDRVLRPVNRELAIAEQDGRFEEEAWRVRKDGSRFWADVVITPLRDPAGRLVGFGKVTRSLSDQAARSKDQFRAAIEAAPTGMVLVDDDGRIVLVNRQIEQLFGFNRDELIGNFVDMLVPPPDRLAHTRSRAAFVRDPQSRPMGAGRELYGLRKDSTQVPVEIGLNPLETPDGRFVLASVLDITERKRSEREREELLERLWKANTALEQRVKARTEDLTAVLENIGDGVVVADTNGRFTHFNPAARRLLGRGPTEEPPDRWPEEFGVFREDGVTPFPASELPLVLAIHGKASDKVDMVVRTALLEPPSYLTMTGRPIQDANNLTTGGVVIIHDLSERKRLLEQIRFAALHDNLTGLANRALFVEALQQAVNRAKRDRMQFAVLYLDLDNFKDINDTLGHPVGDLLLQSFAGRLRSNIREMDTVARFGGDEFALIETNVTEPLNAAVLAEKLLEAVNLPFSIQGNEMHTSVSIGIAVYGPDASNAETLLAHADAALYRAKAEGRGTYRFFTDAMDWEVRERVSLGTELRAAIADGEIFLMYQPQIDVDTGRFVGVEALVRWQHPRRGLMLPSTFIPIAEQTGLIAPLGYWVLHEACHQMKQWIDAGIAPPLMAVNVSKQQFEPPFIFETKIMEILAANALEPQHLEIELTESVLMAVSSTHNDALLRLQKAGYRIAIDDFGTGYSSLDYLGRLSVDRIKIAQSFIVDLTSTSSNTAVVEAAIALARQLNIDVVVKCVETAEQLGLVRSWGCRTVQGYYFSKPLPACDVAPLLRAGNSSPERPVVDDRNRVTLPHALD